MSRMCAFQFDRSELPTAVVKVNDIPDLWVTDPSAELRRKLMATSGISSTILIQPTETCEVEHLSSCSLDLIAQTVKFRSVRSVIVCCQPGNRPEVLSTVANIPQQETNRYQYLLKRICARIERQRHAQARILNHMDQIRSDARIARELAEQQIGLYGMFYIPESDSFLVYDQAIDRFVPITEARL